MAAASESSLATYRLCDSGLVPGSLRPLLHLGALTPLELGCRDE